MRHNQIEQGHFCCPGDIVRLRSQEPELSVPGFTASVKPGNLYRIRSVYPFRSDDQGIRLVGIYGPRASFGEELGFMGSSFEWVASTPALGLPDFESAGQVCEIMIPESIHDTIDKMPADLLLEDVCTIPAEGLEKACGRWTRTYRQSDTIQRMAARLADLLNHEKQVSYACTLSPMATSDLDSICETLGIEPGEWLLGAIGNIARRFTILKEQHERAKRRKTNRKTR